MNDWSKVLVPVILLAAGTLAWYMFIQIENIKETTMPEKYLELRFESQREISTDHEQRIRILENEKRITK